MIGNREKAGVEPIGTNDGRGLTRPNHLSRLHIGLLIGCVLLTSIFPRSGKCDPITVYFYNPENNINNYSLLKSEFDAYLTKFGDYRFQPFSDRKTFERFLADDPDGLFLMSSWHYRQISIRDRLNPVLIGVLQARTTHKHLLYSHQNIKDVESLRDKKIAASGTPEFAAALLEAIFDSSKSDVASTIRILTVPKDIDALMAVGFGIADAALTSENGIEKLARLNPKQYRSLHHLASGQEFLLPVIAMSANPNDTHTALIAVLTKMGAQPDGARPLKLLGLEGWQELQKSQKTRLTARNP